MRDIGLYVSLASALYVLAWFPLAWATGVLLPGQMLRKYPEFKQVIPLIVESYPLADLLFFTPLAGIIVSQVGEEWWDRWMLAWYLFGLVQGYFFQRYIIVPGKYPSSLGGAGRTTLLGVIHIPYFAAMVAIFERFVFTPAPVETSIAAGVAIAFIVPIDILVPTHLIRKWLRLEWVPDVFGEEPRLFVMIGSMWCAVAGAVAFKIFALDSLLRHFGL